MWRMSWESLGGSKVEAALYGGEHILPFEVLFVAGST